jgi:hypothetical protein
LAMVDPDAPSRANHANRYSQKREWHNLWIGPFSLTLKGMASLAGCEHSRWRGWQWECADRIHGSSTAKWKWPSSLCDTHLWTVGQIANSTRYSGVLNNIICIFFFVK